MPDTTLLPDGVTAYTVSSLGDRSITNYSIGDKIILSVQPSDAYPNLKVAVINGRKGMLSDPYAVIRVSESQVSDLVAVLADLHRTVPA